MRLWAIVPVKPLNKGKSRLSEVLPEARRILLNNALYQHTLHVVKQVEQINDILVISQDAKVLQYANEMGMRAMIEEGALDLNAALQQAIQYAKGYLVDSALILPADLPLLTAYDVEYVINITPEPPYLGIVPDRHRQGTNALIMNPLDLINFSYGSGSYHKHVDQALINDANLVIIENQNISIDLDLPEDLQYLEEQLLLKQTQTEINQ